MNKIYISQNAYPELIDLLKTQYEIVLVQSSGIVSNPISNHADIFHCRLGLSGSSQVYNAQYYELNKGYPLEARCNALCTGKFFVHKLSITSKKLLSAAKDIDLTFVDVRQGYTRCNALPVTETAIITSDKGIAIPCKKAGMEVLLVENGNVLLPGYKSGFLGGTGGLVYCKKLRKYVLLFNGDISQHTNFDEIKAFTEAKGVMLWWASDKPLVDIGSIV